MSLPQPEPVHHSLSSPEPAPVRFWFALFLSILGVLILGGTIFAILTYQAGMREAIRVSESMADEDYQKKKMALDTDTIFPGIYVDEVDLGGKTLAEARSLFQDRLEAKAAMVGLIVQIDDQTLRLDAGDVGLTDNSAAVLEQAYRIGRASDNEDMRARVDENYQQVESLKSQPVQLKTALTYDSARVADQITAFVASQQMTAAAAVATDFDPGTGHFTIRERVVGRQTDPVEVVAQVLLQLHQGNYTATVAMESEKEIIGPEAVEIEAELALLGTAKTYAYKIDPPRDNNLQLACDLINGTLIQPGETFSFNEVVGRRTAERGFMEAGVILNGALVKDLGGGVCQVTTTVMQAAMMSDYKLVERSPHSWPSTYTAVGLDATIDWFGPDFKFENNTDFPLGISASYEKPNLTVKIYGRKLAGDMTISLRSTRDATLPVDPPIYKANPNLKPGQVVEIRAERIGQRATAYKVYSQNGKVVREEVLFKSYYRPIQGIYEMGPSIKVADPQPATSAAAGLSD